MPCRPAGGRGRHRRRRAAISSAAEHGAVPGQRGVVAACRRTGQRGGGARALDVVEGGARQGDEGLEPEARPGTRCARPVPSSRRHGWRPRTRRRGSRPGGRRRRRRAIRRAPGRGRRRRGRRPPRTRCRSAAGPGPPRGAAGGRAGAASPAGREGRGHRGRATPTGARRRWPATGMDLGGDLGHGTVGGGDDEDIDAGGGVGEVVAATCSVRCTSHPASASAAASEQPARPGPITRMEVTGTPFCAPAPPRGCRSRQAIQYPHHPTCVTDLSTSSGAGMRGPPAPAPARPAARPRNAAPTSGDGAPPGRLHPPARSPTSSTSTSRVRGPNRTVRARPAASSRRSADLEQLRGATGRCRARPPR